MLFATSRFWNAWFSLPLTAILLVVSQAPASIAWADDDASSPRNIVFVLNRHDESFRMMSKVQLNVIGGDIVTPENFALAQNLCTRCKSISVALQINVYNGSPTLVAPQNVAVAVNANCLECFAYARAGQASFHYDG